jgi:hypothetical protein
MMKPTARYPLKRALKDYRRLCAEPVSGGYNEVSAAVLLRESLATAPWIEEPFLVIGAAVGEVSVLYVMAAMRNHNARSQVGTALLTLYEAGLVLRTYHRMKRGGGQFRYTLSALGRLVLAADVDHGDEPLSRHSRREEGV